MADGCDYLTGHYSNRWSNSSPLGGNFYQTLDGLSDDDWDGIRDMISRQNDADKAKEALTKYRNITGVI